MRLDVSYRDYVASLAKLATFSSSIAGPPIVQKAMAELVLLRMFFRLEAFLADATTRICCGAAYMDGTAPSLLVGSRSKGSAVDKMRHYGRFTPSGAPKAIELKWTMASNIATNVKFVVDASDPFYVVIANHSAELDRLRRTRNHIAHGNRDTSRKFRPVVTHHYGAALSHITPGTLLLSPRFTPNVLSNAFVFCRVLARDLVKA